MREAARLIEQIERQGKQKGKQPAGPAEAIGALQLNAGGEEKEKKRSAVVPVLANLLPHLEYAKRASKGRRKERTDQADCHKA